MSKITYRTYIILIAVASGLLTTIAVISAAFLFMIRGSGEIRQNMTTSTAAGIASLLQDELGSSRIETGDQGTVVIRSDGTQQSLAEALPQLERLESAGIQVAVVKEGRVLWPKGGELARSGSGAVLRVDGQEFVGEMARLQGEDLFVGYPKQTVSFPVWRLVIGSLSMFLLTVLVIVLALWMVSLPTRRLTGETAGAMWALAEGDLGYRMPEKGLVEERMFRRQFNRAVDKIAGFMSRISQLARDVHTAVNQSAAAAEQTGRAIEQQQERVEAGSAALEEVSASVQEVAVSVQTATDLSSEARGLASEGEASVETVADKADSAREAMEQLVEEVGRLEQVASEINAAMDLINDISEETNLLSLNAAIEASRAGEAGRGFAVVADEIRNLAERSVKSARQVKEVVEGITGSLRDVVSGIKQGAEIVRDLSGDIQGTRMTFHLIVNSVDQVADRMLTVSTATEQQSQVISELSNQMSEITDSGQEIAAAAQELSRTSDEIKTRMDELQEMLSQFMGIKDEEKDEPES